MDTPADKIKILREQTGAGISDIKKALEESNGNLEKALKAIERRLGGLAEKKVGRETHAGLIDAYIHSNGRMGSLIEIFCETDFVSRNAAFKELTHDLAMHVAAMRPAYLSFDAVPPEFWQEEKNRIIEETKSLDKPSHLLAEIVEGKLRAHFSPFIFLEQSFVKGQDKNVGEILKEAIGRFGENIKIGRFVSFEL